MRFVCAVVLILGLALPAEASLRKLRPCWVSTNLTANW